MYAALEAQMKEVCFAQNPKRRFDQKEVCKTPQGEEAGREGEESEGGARAHSRETFARLHVNLVIESCRLHTPIFMRARELDGENRRKTSHKIHTYIKHMLRLTISKLRLSTRKTR